MRLSKKKIAVSLGFIIILFLIWFVASGELKRHFFKPTDSSLPAGASIEKAPKDIETIANNLSIPWSIAELPNGDIMFTERPGNIKRIGKNHQTFNVEGVEHAGEGGLLGLTLHPEFDKNGYLYVYLTTKTGDSLTNRVDRYVYKDDKLSDRKTIIENIAGSKVHDGGFMGFGPDKKLYITIGDAGNEANAQDTDSLNGKILRLNDDGTIPSDNPFNNAVYSYGHRNPQGLAWDDKGRLWATEHGPSGTESGNDEINLIKKGSNYGWPVIRGQQARAGMEKPVAESGSNETWAPAGLVFYKGSLYFAGLRGESLYAAKIKSDNSLELKSNFSGDFGRLRAVYITSGGLMLLSTSNTDGRGDPGKKDDRIIQINPAILEE